LKAGPGEKRGFCGQVGRKKVEEAIARKKGILLDRGDARIEWGGGQGEPGAESGGIQGGAWLRPEKGAFVARKRGRKNGKKIPGKERVEAGKKGGGRFRRAMHKNLRPIKKGGKKTGRTHGGGGRASTEHREQGSISRKRLAFRGGSA